MGSEFFLGGFGSDIFGEHDVGRLPRADPVNDYLRTRYLSQYLAWHYKTQKLSPTFDKDL